VFQYPAENALERSRQVILQMWQLEAIVAELQQLSDRLGTKQTMKGLPPVRV